MSSTAKKAPRRSKHRTPRKPSEETDHVTGRIERGKVRLSHPVTWSDGQQVVVLPMPRSFTASAEGIPSLEELEEDAKEFVPRRGSLAAINRSELD